MSSNSSGNSKKRKNAKKKNSNKKKIIITLSVVFLFFLGVIVSVVGYSYSLLGKIDTHTIDEGKLGIDSEIDKALSSYNQIENIAFFGVDAIDGDVGRSDSIIIVTIDKSRNKVKVSSIMRDSYVNIPNHGKDKINHAYAFGGPELAIRTLNENFNLNIKDFASVDFSTLPKVIDALGGIEVEINSEELDWVNSYIDDVNRRNGTNSPHIPKAGLNTLNGTQALGYSRVRYTSGGDYERTQRHRTVLNALFEKFKATPVTSFPKLLNQVLPLAKTSLSSSEILNLATSVVSMGNINLEQERFPRDENSKSTMINNIYYLTFDENTTIKQIHDYIFEDIK